MGREFVVRRVIVVVLAILMAPLALAQRSGVVPNLVKFSGTLTGVNGKPLSGIVGVTFFLYKDQQGGAPLWIETQNVRPDAYGRYTVQLGAMSGQGLPGDVFTSGQARWLGVQAEGQAEQPRVMLLSVPYALKAGDASTVGGLPPSAFALAAPSGAAAVSPGATIAPSVLPALSGTGTTSFVPLWTSGSNLGNSVLFQLGTGSTAKVGINTTTPANTLDVKGGGTIRGALSILGAATLPATGTATSTAGKNSQPEDFIASAFNSGTATAVPQKF